MRFCLLSLRSSKDRALRQQRAGNVFGLSEWARNRLTRKKHHLAVSLRSFAGTSSDLQEACLSSWGTKDLTPLPSGFFATAQKDKRRAESQKAQPEDRNRQSAWTEPIRGMAGGANRKFSHSDRV